MKIIQKIRHSSLVKSSLGIVFITLFAKILGYLEKVGLAYHFGTSDEVDVYTTVVALIFSVFIFFREIIEPGFLNVFLKARSLNDEKGGWKLFNKISRYIVIITVSLSLIVFFFPRFIISVFAPGFTEKNMLVAIDMIQIGFPACVLLALSSLTNITLNALKYFALPASSELAFKVVILTSLLLFYNHLGIYSLLVGLLIGATCKLLIQVFLLYRNISFKITKINPVYSKETCRLTWPLIIGVSFSQLSSLVDNIYASFLQEGAISALSYSKKIIELPILIFPYILSVVIFPYFSELAIAKEKEKLSNLLTQALSWIFLIFLPLSVFFNAFSYEIVEIIFKRGAFNESSTILTATPLSFYSFGMVFFAIETILVIFYYANSDTKTPIIIGIICVVENLIISYFLIATIGYVGIALALVISKTTKVLVLLWIIRKRLVISRTIIFDFYKTIISCMIVAVVLFAFKFFFKHEFSSTLVYKAFFLLSAFVLGAASYSVMMTFLKLRTTLSYKNIPF